MVSNARLDLPEPDRPVTTIRRSRGISSDTSLRLWTRAPCTAMVVRAAAFGLPVRFMGSPQVEERQLLHLHVALLCEPDRCRCLADQALVREVLARPVRAAHVEVALEVVL